MKNLLFAIAILGSAAAAAEAPFEVKVTGHGQPMILIPGLSSSGETWDTTVEHYKDRFECHVLTLAGFAGVPRVAETPMLENVREGIARYIREKGLRKPVIAGHSLGGFIAMDLAARHPGLPGKIVIVDAYPFLAGIMAQNVTAEQAKASADQMRKMMSAQSQEDYERYVKSGMSTRMMVTSDAGHERIIGWGLKSDRTAVTDALAEMMAADLRDEIAHIESPALVLASWIGYKAYTDRAHTEENLKSQYGKLRGVRIELSDTARHFIMWDDPSWMFEHMDRFLGIGSTVSTK